MTDISKKVIMKFIVGFGLGIVGGIIITIIFSLLLNGGKISLISSEFVATIGNKPLAYIIEFILMGMLGLVGYGGSTVYEVEKWSIMKATFIHFFSTFIVFFAVSSTLGWISTEDITGTIIVIACTVVAYIVIWLVQYIRFRIQVRDINSGLEKMKKLDEENNKDDN